MAHKIELPHEDLKMNQLHALKVINSQGRCTNDLMFHFVQDKENQVCLITSFDENKNLPEPVKNVGINYKNLEKRALS